MGDALPSLRRIAKGFFLNLQFRRHEDRDWHPRTPFFLAAEVLPMALSGPVKPGVIISQLGALASVVLFTAGCAFLKPGGTSRIQPVSPAPRAGQVVVIRGFIGIWSLGLDGLAQKINARGIQATVYQNDQWAHIAKTIIRHYENVPNPEPLVIIGHSYGADDAVRIARMLRQHHITVDMLITIDPVTPAPVPGNVRTAIDYYASRGVADNLPWWRGIPLKPEKDFSGTLCNYNLSVNRPDLQVRDYRHAQIPKDVKIHAEILGFLLNLCPPHGQPPPPAPGPRKPAAAPNTAS
jgi:hypothetical protein